MCELKEQQGCVSNIFFRLEVAVASRCVTVLSKYVPGQEQASGRRPQARPHEPMGVPVSPSVRAIVAPCARALQKNLNKTTLSHSRQARHRFGLAINKRKRAPLRARVTAGRRWVCASAWAAEAVCERPGSRVGLWGALCPRGVARLWLGVERGGFCTSCGSSRSSEADRATRVWTCVAAPARGGQVGGCSGGGCSDSGI